MKFDKNTVIGVVLLAILFFAYFYYARIGQIEMATKQKRIADSLAALAPVIKDTAVASQSLSDTTMAATGASGSLVQSGNIKEEFTELQNDLVKIRFSNKGARPVSVQLKKYQSADSIPVNLLSGSFNQFSYQVNTGNNQTAASGDLYFSAAEVKQDAEGGQQIVYTIKDSAGRSIEHRYDLKAGEYMFRLDIAVKGANQLFSNNTLNLLWQVQADQQERDIKTEKRETQLGLHHVGWVEQKLGNRFEMAGHQTKILQYHHHT
jgi:YidC/Oxa1 family membrane protein insertase